MTKSQLITSIMLFCVGLYSLAAPSLASDQESASTSLPVSGADEKALNSSPLVPSSEPSSSDAVAATQVSPPAPSPSVPASLPVSSTDEKGPDGSPLVPPSEPSSADAAAAAQVNRPEPPSQPRSTAANRAASLEEIRVVPLYSQDDLLDWIAQGRHLEQVKQDRCQLTQDIEARATIMAIPAYQFLWGDMLIWGVCVKPKEELGIQYVWNAANQGLAPALAQLGQFYWKGTLVQPDSAQAIILMAEAARLGFLPAQIAWIEMLINGMGSPLDYKEAYSLLHRAVISDKALHRKASQLLAKLANKMPANALRQAKARQ